MPEGREVGLNSTMTAMTVPDAVMSVAISAAASDGRLRPSEISRLQLMAHFSPLFSGVCDVNGYLEALGAEFGRAGTDATLARAAAALDEDLRQTAYAWAVDLAMADRKVIDSEWEFLEKARVALGVDRRLAGKIRAVAGIRLRGA